MKRDPLFKLNEIFGNTIEFVKALSELTGKDDVMPRDITLNNLKKLKPFKKYMREKSLSNMSAGKVSGLVREQFQENFEPSN